MEIRHDPAHHQFSVEYPEGKAVLDYEQNDKTLNFYHTFVPPELRGKGIAEQITKAAFDYAEKNGFKVIPSCPYIARVVMKNDAWKKLVVFK